MEKLIIIVDWNERYENNRTRDLKRMDWLALPIRLGGDGYTALVCDNPAGPAHFGAWCALLEVAARCEPRGTLIRSTGEPHDVQSLFRLTRMPVKLWNECLPRLANLGWITISEIPQDGAEIPQDGAVLLRLNRSAGAGR